MRNPRSRLGKPLILIVDDDDDTADSLAILCELWGYSTAVARDGVAALQAADHFLPDAVLLDLNLPKLDGYQVARQLLHRVDRPLLIAISGRSMSLDRILAREIGIDCYLTKPADPRAVREALSVLTPKRKFESMAVR